MIKLRASRSDGLYLRKTDPLMRFFPFIMKGRNQSAIYFRQQIDVTNLKKWLFEFNHRDLKCDAGNPEERAVHDSKQTSGDPETRTVHATIFHLVLAALIKTALEKPQLNRFIVGSRLYQRNKLTISFVIKREMTEDAKEEIVIMDFDQNDTVENIARRIRNEVGRIRAEARDHAEKHHGAANWLATFLLLPRPTLRAFVSLLTWLDYHGWLPRFVMEQDPMHSSIFVSNLGSLKVDAPFHHLYEWGTTSIFMTIGEMMQVPVVVPGGSIEARDIVNLAFTLDERISDGFYYAKAIKRLQEILENPALSFGNGSES